LANESSKLANESSEYRPARPTILSKYTRSAYKAWPPLSSGGRPARNLHLHAGRGRRLGAYVDYRPQELRDAAAREGHLDRHGALPLANRERSGHRLTTERLVEHDADVWLQSSGGLFYQRPRRDIRRHVAAEPHRAAT